MRTGGGRCVFLTMLPSRGSLTVTRIGFARPANPAAAAERSGAPGAPRGAERDRGGRARRPAGAAGSASFPRPRAGAGGVAAGRARVLPNAGQWFRNQTRSRGSRRRGPARGRRRRRAATPTARAAAPGARSPGRAGAVACAACGIAPDAFPSGRQGQPRQHAARGITRAHPHDERFFYVLSVLYRTRVLSVKLSSTYAGVIRGTMLTLLRTSRRVAVGRTARKPPQYAPISLTIDELLTRAEARAHRTAPHAPWPSRVSLSIAGFCLSLSWRRLTAGSCKLSSQLRHLRAQLDLPCGGLARLPLTLSIHFLDGLAHSSLHLERIGAVEVDNPTAMMRGKQGTRSVRAPLQAPR